MRNKGFLGLLMIASAAAMPCSAETLELKNGSIVQGSYDGGTATTINMKTAQGVLSVPTDDALALKFVDAPAPAAIPPTPTPMPAPAAPAAAAPTSNVPVTVPAGSVLTVRMDTQVSSKDAGGKKFSGKLVADLMAGNVVVAKAGSTVLGQVDKSKQAGRLAGKSQLQMSLVSIDSSGTLVPILTTSFAETGKSSFKKTARNAAGGALVGNAIDDDGGAGKGAAVGVGVSLIREGDSVTVPPGAILEFRLTQPVGMVPSK